MKKLYIAFSLIIIVASVTIVAIASYSPFRFYPTHEIVRQVYCVSCHAGEFEDLKMGRHIRLMSSEQNRTLYDYIDLYGNSNVALAATDLMGSCYTCHVAYQNFNLFGLTDPYVYPAGNIAVNTIGNMAVSQTVYNAQYGSIVSWPWPYGNRIEEYDTGNVAITTELNVLSVQPANAAIDSTIKVVLANYSGQQNGSTACDCSHTLNQGDTQVITVSNIKNDYFSIILLLDGAWNSTTLNLTVSGTDKGAESFIISVSNPPVIYEAPIQISGTNYFKTNGTYRAVRLDAIWYAWRNVSVNGNITSADTIRTSSPGGWTNASSCSAPDGMCHIIQNVTYMGMNDGMDPERSFYPHNMEFVTSKQCKVCHLS
jgi:hypothetical protein